MSTPQTAKITKGPSHAVPCPHCGHRMDFRQLAELGGSRSGKGLAGNTRVRKTADGALESYTDGTGFVETGAKISCERCGRMALVVGVQSVTIVSLRQIAGQVPVAPQAQQRQRPAAPQKPGWLARITGKR